jgi:hypothetical protein
VNPVLCFVCGLQSGFTPLETASQAGHKEVVALLQRGAKVDVGNNVSMRWSRRCPIQVFECWGQWIRDMGTVDQMSKGTKFKSPRVCVQWAIMCQDVYGACCSSTAPCSKYTTTVMHEAMPHVWAICYIECKYTS